MKKRLFVWWTIICMLLSICSGFALPAFGQGHPFAREMEQYPYETTFLVENQQDLTALAKAVNNGRSTKGLTFLQTADITMSGEFTPIGLNHVNDADLDALQTIFKGTYDGQYHTIKNLTINKTAQNGVGLFGACYQATIKNLGIESGSVTGYNRVGGIAGYADNCLVINCYNRADIHSLGGTDGTAGIAGVARKNAVLKGCFNEGAISGSVVSMGGIAGWGQNNVTILGCYNGGTVSNSKSGSGNTDVICRNDSNGARDFSSCYFLSSTCSYNSWKATAMEEPFYELLAYEMNQAGGSQAFRVGEEGLCFSDGKTLEIFRVQHTIDRNGVLLEGESNYYTESNYEIPESQLGMEVDYALVDGQYYLPGDRISIRSDSITVALYMKGSFPSVTEIKSYPDEEYFTVSTAEELAALSPLTAEGYDFKGKTIFIVNDLDFSDYTTWTPIGYVETQSGGTASAASYPFCGSLNGQGYRFENIDFEMSGPFQALFGYVQGATFENIILSEGEMRSDDYRLGALVSLFKDSQAHDIESHISLYSDSTKGNLNMGLFALTYNVTIERVAVYGTIGLSNLQTTQQNGGISGCGYDNATTIQYSFVPAKIHGKEVFQIGQRCVIKNCPLVGSEEMSLEDFIGGKAAWYMNTAAGTKVNCGKWSIGAGGPTLMGGPAAYRLEAVSLNELGDELDVADFYYQEGEQVSFPQLPGYSFLGAYLADERLPKDWAMPAADQTIYLRYEGNTYYIYYHLNGGKNSTEAHEEYVYGDQVLLPDANTVRKEGYSFAGWYETEDFKGEPLKEIPADYSRDVTLYAKWAEPTVITTAQQLCALYKDDLYGCYQLGADIDLTDCDFTPIGTVHMPFMGTFDGNGYTISGLKIESASNYQGLFGYNKGYISNVTLAEDCFVSGNNYVGSIAGGNEGIITDCISNATVSGRQDASKQYSLMSQNLCCWGNQYDIASVADRQPWMVTRIEQQNPDFLGFQECTPAWVDYLSKNISDNYTFMYKYREPTVSSSSESSAIAFKTSKFDLLESGHFWLSETPDICSKGWDASHWRICQWMILQDKENGQKIGVFNTHFDLTDTAKAGAAEVMQERLQKALKEHPDMILLACGDFNSEESTTPYKTLTKNGIIDARYSAPITTDDYTHTKGAGWGDGVRSIDYIFGHEDRTIFDEFDVLNELSETNQRLSDHNGVLARFRGKNGNNIGGAIGLNKGYAERLILRGAVSGIENLGLAIGQESGFSNHLYVGAEGALPLIGAGDDPYEWDDETLYDYDTISFLYLLNRDAPAFTLKDGMAAVAGTAQGIPVKVTVNGAEEYHLSGTGVTLDAADYTDPVCTLDGQYFEGLSFIVPDHDCIVTIQNAAICTEHTYGEWYVLDENRHIRYCQANPSHIDTAEHVLEIVEETGADCYGPELIRRACKDCGYEKIEVSGQPLNHAFGDWESLDATTHFRVCDNDSTHIENQPHQFADPIPLEATCEKGAGELLVCIDCGYAKEEFTTLPLGHLYGAAIAFDAEGHHRVCQRDSKHLLKEPHRSTAEPIAISCEAGEGIAYHCRICKDDYQVYHGEGIGHQYGGWQKLDDQKHIRTCGNDPEHTEIADHRYDEGTYHGADCTHGDYTRFECLDCTYFYDAMGENAALGHSYGPWEIETSATEHERGLMKRKCSACEVWEERIIPCSEDPAVVAVLKEIDAQGNVKIDLVLQNNPGIAGIGVRVYYDGEDLIPHEQTPLIRGEALSKMLFSPYVDRENQSIKILGCDTKLSNDSGVLYTMQFKLTDEAKVSTLLRIEVSRANTVDADYQMVTLYDRDLEFETGVVHYHDYRWQAQEGKYSCEGCDTDWEAGGDISGDDTLTTLDALLLLRHLLGVGVEIAPQVADFSQNGTVGIHDVVMILRVLNGKI